MKKTSNFTSYSKGEGARFSLLKKAKSKHLYYEIPKCKSIIVCCCWLPVILLLCPGCISLYYAPNSQNVPMFTGKNQTEASLAFQFGTLTLGCDADFAYSFTNHFGLMVNYNHWSAKKRTTLFHSDEEFVVTGISDMVEVGAGYYLPFQDKFVFETYGGGGWGGVKTDYESQRNSKLKYNRYFIQSSCGYYYKKLNLILSLRLCGIDYNRLEYDPGISGSDKQDLEFITDNPFSLYLEPAFTLRLGGDKVKFQYQVVFSDNLNTPELLYEPLCATIGLVFLFPNKKDI